MDQKTQALALLNHWSANGYAAPTPFAVAAPVYGKQQQQPQKKGSLLSHLLPSIGGIGGGVAGGAAGGALAGTALLPGVGTAVGGLLGALLGGGAGGAAGKVAENATEHQALGKGVLGQGLEQGALSAGPLRLLKTAGAAAKAGTGLVDAFGEGGAANAAAGAPGVLSKIGGAVGNKGQQLEARSGGFGVGEKAPGGVQLGVQDSRNVGDVLKANGIPAGSPETRLEAVENKVGTLGQQIDSHVATNNTPLNPGDVKQIAADYLTQVQQQPGVDQLVMKKATNFATNLENQVTDTKSLIDFRRGLDKQVINFNANGQGASPAAQIAARTLRGMLSDKTEQLAPGIGGLNKSYSQLSDAAGFLKGGAKAVSDQSQGQGGGGLLGRALTNDTAQAAKSKLGTAMQGAGGQESNPFSAGAIAARTLPVGLATSGASAVQPQPMNTNSANQMTTTQNNTSNMSDLSQSPSDLSSADQSSLDPNSPFAPQNVEQSVTQILQSGDKNAVSEASSFISMAKQIQGMTAPQSNTGNTIKPTGQQYGLATGGMNALQQLGTLIQQDPSVVEKNATPGQGLPLVGSLITNAAGAGSYHPLADNVLQALIHLDTGATATPEEVKAARGQLPQPGDSPAEQQRKLNNLEAQFAPYLQGGQIGGSNNIPNSLLNALSISQ